jgi:molybdopterin/thiamine biosynthesis adenylyltransferase
MTATRAELREMLTREDFYDRLRRQDGWRLDRLNNCLLVLVGNAYGMTRTLALAAVSSGMKNLVMYGACESGEFLYSVSGDVMRHRGEETTFIPVYSGMFFPAKRDRTKVWLIDAGDARNDKMNAGDDVAIYYAECHEEGEEFIAVGTDRYTVSFSRKGTAASDRAEIAMVCSQLLIGALAAMGACDELEPLPGYCRVSLPKTPEDLDSIQNGASSVLYAGGGGAIAHQELWTESMDPVLKKINNTRRHHFLIVDPSTVHESCRSRQWGYPAGSCGKSKATCTAKWVSTLFPQARVTHIKGRLNREHFHHYCAKEAFSSIDNWTGRKVLSQFADVYGIPWWSCGSSFFGGFARQVSQQNPWCASADDGIERLRDRPEDDLGRETSCSAAETPMPSSVLPQMVLGGFVAAQRRQLFLGEADPRTLCRGIEVHLTYGSKVPGYEGLRWSPGRALNVRNPD